MSQCLLLIFLSLLAALELACAFLRPSPTLGMPRFPKGRSSPPSATATFTRSQSHLLRSTTESGSANDVAASISDQQQVARAALEKLRARQLSELEETERLLDLVTNPEIDHSSASTPTFMSTAASLLSGFDYGFVGRSDGVPPTLKGGVEELANKYPGPPPNLWKLGTTQFIRNLKAILGEYSDEPETLLTPQQVEMQEKLNQLTLNSTQIWEREEALGPILAPWIIKLPYLAVCYLLDVVFEHRYVPSRFFLRKWDSPPVLRSLLNKPGLTSPLFSCLMFITPHAIAVETVARMPYFSYSKYLQKDLLMAANGCTLRLFCFSSHFSLFLASPVSLLRSQSECFTFTRPLAFGAVLPI